MGTASLNLEKLKVAIVHYWFMSWRGGEKVVHSLLKLFPRADIYTLFHDPELCRVQLGQRNIRSSLLDLPFLRRKYQKLFPLYPFAVRSLRLRAGYDLIISSESGPAKGVENPTRIPHLCYVETPMRYCWGYTEEYLNSTPRVLRPLARYTFQYLRRWDLTTVDKVDLYVANSLNIQERIRKYYHREAQVIYPPVEERLFARPPRQVQQIGDYYLWLGALTPYKRSDLAVQACVQSGRKLVVIGEGSERKKTQKLANEKIAFLGHLSDEQIEDWVRRAKALIFPGEEDFGLVPVEVMARGVPVIAYGKGGALETVIENREEPHRSTGCFFQEQTVDSLLEALEWFEEHERAFDPHTIRQNAWRFRESVFLEQIRATVQDFLGR